MKTMIAILLTAAVVSCNAEQPQVTAAAQPAAAPWESAGRGATSANQPPAQAQQRFTVDLANSGLTDSYDFTDLAQIKFFLIVQGHD